MTAMNAERFKEIAASYIASLEGTKSPRTIGNYELALRKFGEYLTGRGCEASALAVSSFKSEMLLSGVSVGSARAYLAALHAFFSWCVRMGIENSNPVLKEEMLKEARIEYAIPEGGEIVTILSDAERSLERAVALEKRAGRAVKGKNALRNDCIMILLLQTGLRSSELRALTPADLDFEKGTIRVLHGKGDKYREAPFPTLSKRSVRFYIDRIRPEGLSSDQPLFGSFANESGHAGNEWHSLGTVALNGIVKRYMKRKTGKEYHTHTMRHAAASFWDDLGVPIRDVQNALGHSSVTTTERVYIKVLNKGKAAANINAAFDLTDERRSQEDMYYGECPKCGAALDPGEKCDCTSPEAIRERNAALIRAALGTERKISENNGTTVKKTGNDAVKARAEKERVKREELAARKERAAREERAEIEKRTEKRRESDLLDLKRRAAIALVSDEQVSEFMREVREHIRRQERDKERGKVAIKSGGSLKVENEKNAKKKTQENFGDKSGEEKSERVAENRGSDRNSMYRILSRTGKDAADSITYTAFFSGLAKYCGR